METEVTLDYQTGLLIIGSSQIRMYSNDIRSMVTLNNKVILLPLTATTVVVRVDIEITSSEVFGDYNGIPLS